MNGRLGLVNNIGDIRILSKMRFKFQPPSTKYHTYNLTDGIEEAAVERRNFKRSIKFQQSVYFLSKTFCIINTTWFPDFC